MNRDSLFNNFGFDIGFWQGVLFIAVVNYLSYLKALKNYDPNFIGSLGVIWGFPYKWQFYGGVVPNLVYNVFVYILICFEPGLIMRFVWSRFSNTE